MIRPCWILCTPRTGSSYLCDLLNNTGIFPIYEDLRLKLQRGPIQKGRAFNEWLRIFNGPLDLMSNAPLCCKAIYHQYIEVMGAVPLESRRKPPDETGYASIDKQAEAFVQEKYWTDVIKAILPGIRFIHLIRNPVGQAVSTYFARKTRIYHLYGSEETREYMAQNVPVDISALKSIYEEVKQDQNNWKVLLRDNAYYELRYEDLINDPVPFMNEIVKYVGGNLSRADLEQACLTTNHQKRLFRMTRPEASYLEGLLVNQVPLL